MHVRSLSDRALEARLTDVNAELARLQAKKNRTAAQEQRASELLAESTALQGEKVGRDYFREATKDGFGTEDGAYSTKPRDGRGLFEPYREGEALRSGQTFAGYVESQGLVADNERDLNLGRFLRGAATGNWTDAREEQRALSESVQADGGFLLPTPLSATLVDRVRNEAAVLRAGASVLPMTTSKIDLPLWLTDPSVAWHTENAVVSPSQPTLGRTTLEVRTLAGLVTASRELLEDTDVEGPLTRALSEVVSLEVDRVLLYGTGTAPEPRGLKATTGVTLADHGGANGGTTTYAALTGAVGTLHDRNVNPTAVVHSARTARVLSGLTDTTGQPLQQPPLLEGLSRYATNQVPNNLTLGTSTDTSDAFVGYWPSLTLGVRTQFQIQVLRERYAESGTVGFLVWLRAGVAVTRPSDFVVVRGLRP